MLADECKLISRASLSFGRHEFFFMPSDRKQPVEIYAQSDLKEKVHSTVKQREIS